MASIIEKILVYFGFKETGKSKIDLTNSDLVEIEQKIKTANLPQFLPDDYTRGICCCEPVAASDDEARYSKRRGGDDAHLSLQRIVKNAADFSSILNSIELLPEYHEALSHFCSQADNEITFVSGGAGTGKSVFVKWLTTRLPKDRFVILCPTGAAAINVGGSTVHSFCRFRPAIAEFRELLRDDDYKNSNVLKKIATQIEYIIFDEISMVRCDLFDAVDEFFRHFTGNGNSAFGGRKLLVVGDLLQLPPVVTEDDEPDLRRLGYSYPFFCFNSNAWIQSKIKLIPLTRGLRQSSKQYYRHLNRIRLAQNLPETVRFFNDACQLENSARFPVLTTIRRLAARINRDEIETLPGQPFSFVGQIFNDFPRNERDLPAPVNLSLKIGARVMIVKNDPGGDFVNGSIGVVTKIVPSSEIGIDGYIEVILDREPKKKVQVTKAIWERYRYVYSSQKKQYIQQVVGRYIQMPLTLAWAITIHKAQGMTIPSLSVDVGRGAFAAGQMYVALSRCPTLAGLSLEQELRERDVFHSQEAEAEYRRIQNLSMSHFPAATSPLSVTQNGPMEAGE